MIQFQLLMFTDLIIIVKQQKILLLKVLKNYIINILIQIMKNMYKLIILVK